MTSLVVLTIGHRLGHPRYLVVNTGSWLSDRKVLISPIAVGHAGWMAKRLPVALTSLDDVQQTLEALGILSVSGTSARRARGRSIPDSSFRTRAWPYHFISSRGASARF